MKRQTTGTHNAKISKCNKRSLVAMPKNNKTKTFTIKVNRLSDDILTSMHSDEELIFLLLQKGGMMSVSAVKENE
jgi:hypothetical protein